MYRWTARFVLLVMLAPITGPLALASTAPPPMQCCVRRPLTTAPVPAAESTMPCHHGASQAAGGQARRRRKLLSVRWTAAANTVAARTRRLRNGRGPPQTISWSTSRLSAISAQQPPLGLPLFYSARIPRALLLAASSQLNHLRRTRGRCPPGLARVRCGSRWHG